MNSVISHIFFTDRPTLTFQDKKKNLVMVIFFNFQYTDRQHQIASPDIRHAKDQRSVAWGIPGCEDGGQK